MTLLAIAREALDLLTPALCAGCGRPDQTICGECAAGLFDTPGRVDGTAPELAVADRAEELPTWAAARYAGTTRHVVLAWKRGRGDIEGVIAAAARELLDQLLAGSPALAAGSRPGAGEGERGAGVRTRPFVFVPAPSGWRRRASGLLVAMRMAGMLKEAADELVPVRGGHRAADVLRREGGPVHLAGRSAAGRAAARRGRIHAIRQPPPGRVVLVDDVLTTGATLRACARALAEAGRTPVAALVLAASPPSRRRQDSPTPLPGNTEGVGDAARRPAPVDSGNRPARKLSE